MGETLPSPDRQEKPTLLEQELGLNNTNQQARTDLASKSALELLYNDDLTTIKSSSIEEIRKNPWLLTKITDKDSVENKIRGVKQETIRRISIYTSKKSDDWYTIDYASKGSDKEGLSHEENIGLGDILLDSGIEAVQVKKDGELINGHRGIVQSGRHKGRLGFLDENNQYIATHTGDQFKISAKTTININIPDVKSEYFRNLQKEIKIRKDNVASNYEPINLDEKNSDVVSLINIRLNREQKENALIVEQVFKEAGLPASVTAAALVNAHAESKIRNIKCRIPGEDSAGIFQLNIRGAGHGMSLKDRLDPQKNAKRIVKVIKGRFGKKLLKAAKNGASVNELAAIFSRDIERPKETQLAMSHRRQLAQRMFRNHIPYEPQRALVQNTAQESPERFNPEKTVVLGASLLGGAANQFPRGITNLTQKGKGISYMRRIFDKNIKPHPGKFNTLVLSGATVNSFPQGSLNQAKIDNAFAQITEDMSYIIQSAKEMGLKVVVITHPPWGKRIQEIADKVPAKSSERFALLQSLQDRVSQWTMNNSKIDKAIPLHKEFADPSNDKMLAKNLGNGWHLNSKGYRKMKDRIISELS